jgi:aminoglycoside 6-adenylyltransferase
LNNVAKGIARDELPYAMEMFNHYVRDMLHILVEWYIGIQTDFSVSAGKMGKYFKKYLPPELYAQYTATYCGSNYTDIWAAVDTMCNLFHTLALTVATHLDFTYRQEEEAGLREYLRMVKSNEY